MINGDKKSVLGDKTKNISTDNQEIGPIADKLRESLKMKNTATKNYAQKDKLTNGMTLAVKNEAHSNNPLKASSGDSGFLNHDDTIHIDQDGNITSFDNKA